jgi:hypothetical protein
MMCKNCIGGEMYKYGKTKDGRQVYKCRICKTKRVEYKLKRTFLRSKETCEKIRQAKLKYWAKKERVVKVKSQKYLGKFFEFEVSVWKPKRNKNKKMVVK